jgi:hypothetical protein
MAEILVIEGLATKPGPISAGDSERSGCESCGFFLSAPCAARSSRLFRDAAEISGLYTFGYTKAAEEIRVPVRFTFVYRKTAKGWLIVAHHSSVLHEAQ